MNELVYDVQNKTYLTGRSRNNGTNHEEVAHMQANDDEENANQIARSISNAFANMQTQLSEYIDEATINGETASNELIPVDADLSVTLSMPSNYNKTVSDSVAATIHQYLVNCALADWFLITDKADAQDYAAMAQANIETVRNAINRRVRPTRAEV